MSDTINTAPHADEVPVLSPASAARLRALSRAGFEPKTFIKSVTPFEIAALVLLLTVVASVFVIYTWAILPDQVTYVQLSNQKAENQAKIEELQTRVVDPNAIASQYKGIRDSLDQFRGNALRPRADGTRDILKAIDRALNETGAQLTGPVKFAADRADAEAGAAARGAAKVRKRAEDHGIRSFPSLGMEISVAGSYNQVRSFISRFEGSNQFVVIDKISLTKDDAEDRLAERRGASQPSAGQIVLSISMTAFFQPDGAPSVEGVH